MFRPTRLTTAILLLGSLSFLCLSATAAAQPPGDSSKPELTGRLAIIRYVDEEYARVVQPLPSRKKGFSYKVGQKIDPNKLRSALAYGAAANPGDQVQITDIQFRHKSIIVSINGGTKKHWDWRKHIQISMGGAVPVVQSTPANSQGPTRIGAQLVLEFPSGVPDLTPDQLKQDLSPFLNFESEHSAAVNWIDTLPPQFKNAIENHKAIAGMDRDMVLAALGRPDKKVREFDENGHQTEDWIYGLPPERSTLVTFSGNKVIRVKTYG